MRQSYNTRIQSEDRFWWVPLAIVALLALVGYIAGRILFPFEDGVDPASVRGGAKAVPEKRPAKLMTLSLSIRLM